MSKTRKKARAKAQSASIPRLCKRRSPSSGKTLAYAKFNGRTITFGAYDDGAVTRYETFVAQWLARGRRLEEDRDESYTVRDLVADYLIHCEAIYRDADGNPTGSVADARRAVEPLMAQFRRLDAAAIDLAALKVYRQAIVETGVARNTVNKKVQVIKRMFSWAASEELVPPTVAVTLQALEPLKRNRTPAPDHPPRTPAPWQDVEKTLPFLTPTLQAFVMVLWWTGARVGEIAQLRTRDVDMTGDVWVFRPPRHKTAFRGKVRTIDLGERAQEALGPFVQLDPDRFWFRPCDSAEQHLAARRAARKTPLWDSHVRRYEVQRQRPKVKTPPGQEFCKDVVATAIRRACQRAGVPPWTPHQLRHAALSRIRKEHGIEAAQAIGGHGCLGMTEHYTESARRELAREVAGKTG